MREDVHIHFLLSRERNLSWKLIRIWLYRSCFFSSILLLVGFSAVLPIDSIAQASVSDNNALNTFIVVGAIVVFFIICIVIVIGRLIYRKSCLIDIPRRYLPVTSADLPHKESREYILQNMNRSKELGIYFKKPKDPVIHDGLEPPLRCDIQFQDPNTDNKNGGDLYRRKQKQRKSNSGSNNSIMAGSLGKIFPEYLNYETCMKVVSNRIKYQGYFLSVINFGFETQDTFSDIIRKQFIDGNETNSIQVEKAKRYISLYQYLQYSGKPIKREDFIEFVELSIYFADTLATSDKSIRNNHIDTLMKLNTKSNQSLRNPGVNGFSSTIPLANNNIDNVNHKQMSSKSARLGDDDIKIASFPENNEKIYNNRIDNEEFLLRNPFVSNISVDKISNNSSELAPDEISYFPSTSSQSKNEGG
ncbi:Dlt1p PWA37_004130 [Arxiozyma heterogenica]|uniref:Defect at low temperature protein 1 n=1 Tax=Arxiozyma heterogenica TaxID=278026 RepID=A0AAN7ZS73_9SACH|nr:hypothetical protein RI543_003152 [Kazachstania heterogenica]